jgi:hypothetical protein
VINKNVYCLILFQQGCSFGAHEKATSELRNHHDCGETWIGIGKEFSYPAMNVDNYSINGTSDFTLRNLRFDTSDFDPIFRDRFLSQLERCERLLILGKR